MNNIEKIEEFEKIISSLTPSHFILMEKLNKIELKLNELLKKGSD
jgi:hypothetical protein